MANWLNWVQVVWIALWLGVLVLAAALVIESLRMNRRRRSRRP
jgi:hypothetical protein